MPEYLSPGVYVEEIDTGPVPIEGVSTSTVGFVGMTAQGPTDGLPLLVTSFGEYVRTFGGYLPASFGKDRFLPYAVQGFFDNGGQRAYIKRVVPDLKTGNGKAASSNNLTTGVVTRLATDFTLSTDPKVDNKHIQLSTLRGIQVDTQLTLTQIKYGVTKAEAGPMTVASYDDSTKTVILTAPLTNSYEARYTSIKVNTIADPKINHLSGPLKTGDTTVQLSTLRGIQKGSQLTFTQEKAGTTTTENGKVKSYDASTKTITLEAPLAHDYEAASTTVTSDTSPVVAINAINPGGWGNSLAIRVFQVSKTKAQVQPGIAVSAPGKFDTVLLNTASNFYPGAIVEFNRGNHKVYGKVKDVLGTNIILYTSFTAADALSPDLANFTTTASTCEFRLNVANKDISEDYPLLTLDSTTPYSIGNLVNNQSSLISITGSDDNGEDPFIMPSTNDGLNVVMVQGSDGTPGGDGNVLGPNDYIGVDGGPGKRTGIKALEDIEQISIIAVPGITDQAVINTLIEQCERLKYRFAIIDSDYTIKYGKTPLEAVQNYRSLYDTHYAALYFPNLVISNPDVSSPAGSTIVIPPSGHMAGIYARTDTERGVHKAPANEVILGITDLDLTINKGEQDVLNPLPNNINVLRDFRHQGRGLRVWGARCITSDTQWKYVNVRRLFIFIEDSLDQGTQWVVFEPNDAPLWARVTQSITNFLTRVWHDGALMGQKVEEAFFVRVGRSTMTQDDIDNGRLIILVGIAPVKPAEFVIIRISQSTAVTSTAQ